MLQERYLSAAEKISAAAVGGPERAAAVDTRYPVPADRTQTRHIDGLALGTRGGVLIHHTFPTDGEYVIAPRLWKTNNWVIRGALHRHELEITVDGERVHLAAVGGPRSPALDAADAGASPEDINNRIFARLQVRVPMKAGPHAIGVAFVYRSVGQEPHLLQPLESRIDAVDPLGMPQVEVVMISGPFNPAGAGDTPSRRRIFICRPDSPADEAPCARTILATLARRAYRRPVTDADLASLLKFYDRARQETGGFEAGIQVALRRMLADPKFVFRAEQDPAAAPPGSIHRLSDLELASRLSFFLWSSIPDDELLELAIRNRLGDRAVLEQQVRRLLADPRSRALVNNFAGQWLYIRNLKGSNPDRMAYADFDDNLRQAFQRETEMFFESIMREDRNVLDLLTADYTFVNERLARHYGIPNVYGSQFRRVTVRDECAPGAARQGQHPHRDVARRSHVAGSARQVDPGKRPRVAAAAAAADGAALPGEQRRTGAHRARTARAAPRQSRVCGLSSADGSDRSGARELRRSGPLAHQGGCQSDRGLRPDLRRHRRRRPGRAAEGAAQSAGELRQHADREAPDLCPRPWLSSIPTCRPSAPSSAMRRATTIGSRPSCRRSPPASRFRCGRRRTSMTTRHCRRAGVATHEAGFADES